MKRIVIYIVSIFILLSPFLFFYLQESKAEGKPQISTEETQKELVEFNDDLFKEGGSFPR